VRINVAGNYFVKAAYTHRQNRFSRALFALRETRWRRGLWGKTPNRWRKKKTCDAANAVKRSQSWACHSFVFPTKYSAFRESAVILVNRCPRAAPADIEVRSLFSRLCWQNRGVIVVTNSWYASRSNVDCTLFKSPMRTPLLKCFERKRFLKLDRFPHISAAKVCWAIHLYTPELLFLVKHLTHSASEKYGVFQTIVKTFD